MTNHKVKFNQTWIKGLVESPSIGILVLDMNREILFVNDFFCCTIGYEEKELIGETTKMFYISDEAYEEFGAKTLENLANGKPTDFEFEYKRKDGSHHWAYLSGYIFKEEEVIVWMMLDITDKIIVRKELLRAKERLEIAFYGSRDVVWDWDLDSGEFFVTQIWKDMVGYDEKNVPYNIKEWRKYIHPDDLRQALVDITSCMKGENKYLDCTYRLHHKDGHWIWINMRGAVEYSPNTNSNRMVGTQRDISVEKALQAEIEEQKLKLQYQANYDSLTGLPNRLLFHDRLDQAIKKAKRYKIKMALFFIDLDHFKEINDTMGHKTGDKVLEIVSAKLKKIVREEDTVARLGGDEFTIILENIKTKAIISSLAKKIVKSLAKPIDFEDELMQITCSIGISMYPADSTDSDTLLSCADSAMYDAKANGKNNFQFYSVK